MKPSEKIENDEALESILHALDSLWSFANFLGTPGEKRSSRIIAANHLVSAANTILEKETGFNLDDIEPDFGSGPDLFYDVKKALDEYAERRNS